MTDKPKYNPNIHHRRSIRLKGYDYAQAGLYFITICCERRDDRKGLPAQQMPFGHIENDEMVLNELGNIAYNEWAKLAERFPNFELDVFQIMPNHIHGIIALVGATLAVAQIDGIAQNDNDICDNKIGQLQKGQPQGIAPTVGDIVGAYKSLVANGCLDIYKSKNEMMGKLWQRYYHEHIVRNEQSYQTISNYIINNPAKWGKDKFYNK